MRALIDDREEGSRKEEAPEIRPEEERIPEEDWEEDLEEDWDDLEAVSYTHLTPFGVPVLPEVKII